MRDFTISRRSLVVLFSSVALITAVVFVIRSFGDSVSRPTPTPPIGDNQATAALVAGIEAFFQVDFREDKETWLTRFCSTSTEAGCRFASSGSTGLWKRFTDTNTIVTADVTARSLIRETADEQIWLASIQLSQPLPGNENTLDEAYAIVLRENGAWKFDRFLLRQEIEAIHPAGREKLR